MKYEMEAQVCTDYVMSNIWIYSSLREFYAMSSSLNFDILNQYGIPVKIFMNYITYLDNGLIFINFEIIFCIINQFPNSLFM